MLTSEVFDGLKAGGYAALALIMFMGNSLLNMSLKREMEDVKVTVSNAVTAISTVASAVTASTNKLADSLTKVLDSQHEMVANQMVQSTNQLNQTHALNEVVRELIGIIRAGDRG